MKDDISKVLDMTVMEEDTFAAPTVADISTELEVIGEDEMSPDVKLARENILKSIETTNNTLAEITAIARESQHPQAYDSVGKLMNSIIKANAALVDLNVMIESKEKEEEANAAPLAPTNVIIATTEEIIEMVRANAKK